MLRDRTHHGEVKMRKLAYIKGFGIELEGGWERKRYDNYRIEGIMKGDSSVNTTPDLIAGEIAGPVFKDMTTAWEFLKDYYPNEVNSSAGLHVHISVKDSDYVKLMEGEFCQEFLNWAKELLQKNKKRLPPTFEDRMEGKNRYCKKEFHPVKQIGMVAERYTQLNFCCKRAHSTMENRMLPGASDPKTAFFMITSYLLMVEKYLKKTPSKAKTHEIKIELEKENKETKPVKIETEIGEMLICA